ncbi:MAG: hypothetical protein WDW36_004579 [Sanguina aurantia]
MAGEVLGGDLVRVVQPLERVADSDGTGEDTCDTDQGQYYVTGVAKARLEIFHRQASLARQLQQMGLPTLKEDAPAESTPAPAPLSHQQQPAARAWREELNGGGLGNLLQQRDRKAKAKAAGRASSIPPSSARLQRRDDLADGPARSAASKLHLLSASAHDPGVILRSRPVSKPTHPARQLGAAPSNEALQGDMMGVRVRKQLAIDSQRRDFVSQRHAEVAREAADRQKQLRDLAAVIIAAHEQGVTLLGVPVTALYGGSTPPAPVTHQDGQAAGRPASSSSGPQSGAPPSAPHLPRSIPTAATHTAATAGTTAAGGGGGGIGRLRPQVRQQVRQQQQQRPPTFHRGTDSGIAVVQYSRRVTAPGAQTHGGSVLPAAASTVPPTSLSANRPTTHQSPTPAQADSIGVGTPQPAVPRHRHRHTSRPQHGPTHASVLSLAGPPPHPESDPTSTVAPLTPGPGPGRSHKPQAPPSAGASSTDLGQARSGQAMLAAPPAVATAPGDAWDKFADASDGEQGSGVEESPGVAGAGGRGSSSGSSDEDDEDGGGGGGAGREGSDGGGGSSWGVSSTDSMGYPLHFGGHPARQGSEAPGEGEGQARRRRGTTGSGPVSGSRDDGVQPRRRPSRPGAVAGAPDSTCLDGDEGCDECDSDTESTGSWGVRQPEVKQAAGGGGGPGAGVAAVGREAVGKQLPSTGAAGTDLSQLMLRYGVGDAQREVVDPRDIPQLALSALPAWLLEPLPWYKAHSACTDRAPGTDFTSPTPAPAPAAAALPPPPPPAAAAPVAAAPPAPAVPGSVPAPPAAAAAPVAAPVAAPAPAAAAPPPQIPTDLTFQCGGGGSDVLTFLQAQPQLRTLSAALVSAQLSPRLGDTSHPITLFAPTDKAFAQWEADSNISAMSIPSLDLRPLLLYHIVAGGVTPSQLLNTPFLATGCTGQQLFGLERAKISGEKSHANILRSVRLCQSYVYLIDYVLLSDSTPGPLGLPTCEESGLSGPVANVTATTNSTNREPCTAGATAWQAIQNNTMLSTTAGVIQLTGFEGLMENATARFTLLAPTNDAWVAAAAALNTTLPKLLSNATELMSIIQAHILPWNAPARKLGNRMYLTLQADSPISVKVADRDIRLQSPTSDASVLMADIDLSCTSAVHTISALLIPPALLPTPAGPKVSASSRGRKAAF